MASERRSKLLLASFASVLAWLAAEVALRLLPPAALERLQTIQAQRAGRREAHPRGLYRIGAGGLWTLTPGLRGVFRGEDFAVEVRANADGLRDRELAAKPEGTFRILGLGDSFAFGWGVRNEDSFLKLLEAGLSRTRGAAYEVVNAGIPGFGTYEELELLKALGQRYQPDLVLLALYEGNDYQNNGDAPRSRVIEDGYLRDGPRQDAGWLARIAAHSAVASLARAAGDGLALKRRLASDVLKTKQRVVEMHSLLAARNVPLVLVLIPDQDPEAYRRPRVLGLVDRLASPTTPREARQQLRSLCRDRGIACCELSSRFEGAATGLRLTDTHWNRAGHAAAADEILACLLPHL